MFCLVLKGWFHGSTHVQAMAQDKSIPLFMDQSEASMLSRAKFARDSLPVKFTVSWLSHSIDSLLVLSFGKLALEILSAPAESSSCKCNGVCSRKDGILSSKKIHGLDSRLDFHRSLMSGLRGLPSRAAAVNEA